MQAKLRFMLESFLDTRMAQEKHSYPTDYYEKSSSNEELHNPKFEFSIKDNPVSDLCLEFSYVVVQLSLKVGIDRVEL